MKPANEPYVPDDEMLALLYTRPAFKLTRAAEALGVSLRQVRRLAADGKLEKVGTGQAKRITTRSILARLGLLVETKTDVTGP